MMLFTVKNMINNRLMQVINNDAECWKLFSLKKENKYTEELLSYEYRLWYALMRIYNEIKCHEKRIKQCNYNDSLKEMLLIDEELLYDEAIQLLNDYDIFYSPEKCEHNYHFLHGDSIIDKLHRNYEKMKMSII